MLAQQNLHHGCRCHSMIGTIALSAAACSPCVWNPPNKSKYCKGCFTLHTYLDHPQNLLDLLCNIRMAEHANAVLTTFLVIHLYQRKNAKVSLQM